MQARARHKPPLGLLPKLPVGGVGERRESGGLPTT
jgi:hypothetical protein